jgi:class 3 adenylate cyclase
MKNLTCPSLYQGTSPSQVASSAGASGGYTVLAATAVLSAMASSLATAFVLKRLNRRQQRSSSRHPSLKRESNSNVSGSYASALDLFDEAEHDEHEQDALDVSNENKRSSIITRATTCSDYTDADGSTLLPRQPQEEEGAHHVSLPQSQSQQQQQELEKPRPRRVPQHQYNHQPSSDTTNTPQEQSTPAHQILNYPEESQSHKPHFNRQSSLESDVPSDEWFQKFIVDNSFNADEIDPEEINNRSGLNEYLERVGNDKVGSLRQVRRSIMGRRSISTGGGSQENEGGEGYYNNASIGSTASSSAVVGSGSPNTTSRGDKQRSVTIAAHHPNSASFNLKNRRRSSIENMYSNPSEYGRRRSSLYNRRRLSSITGGSAYRGDLTRCSACDSITTCDEEDNQETNFSFEHNHQKQFPSHLSRSKRRLLSEQDSYISETEILVKGEMGFEESIMGLVRDLPSSLQLLRQTRAISALAHRLMAAPDEAACIEEVTKLLAVMFGLKRVSFAMLTGTEHFLLKRVVIKQKELGESTKDDVNASFTSSGNATNATASGSFGSTFELEYLDSDYKRPLEGTAAGICANTLKEHYTPQTEFSDFATHKVFYKQGLNTVLATPILVNGNKCAGCILLSMKEIDAFKKPDRVLIADIASLMGANLYAKRLKKASDDANKISREMLHSFVPEKVLEKIEGYWDAKSEKYKRRKDISSSSPDGSVVGAESTAAESTVSSGSTPKEAARSNSWYVANMDWGEADAEKEKDKTRKGKGGIRDKIQLIKKLNRDEDDSNAENVGVIITTKGLDLEDELRPSSKALYAETARNVSIIFTDIVGFSRITLDVAPIRVMNMLQNLFNRFDELCDIHGVMKLETIGDAYLCATNLLGDHDGDEDAAKDGAVRALAMAKDMVKEARRVRIPIPHHDAVHVPWASNAYDTVDYLEIRVGIHVGDITCGVLGQKLPKFTTCGTTVNTSARMEQTSLPSMIRATKAFHDLIGDAEKEWMEMETVNIKNMGQIETFLLDPLSTHEGLDEIRLSG